jgi:RNA polymerase sigma-70 factor (ECF subfamily)
VHTDAATYAGTDWAQVVRLYDQLMALAPTPVVALNRAVAVAELSGAAAGLTLVDELPLRGYRGFHVARAELLRRLGRAAEAAQAYRAALELAPSGPESRLLSARLAALGEARQRERPSTLGGKGEARSPS